jgi:hypothetical protein
MMLGELSYKIYNINIFKTQICYKFYNTIKIKAQMSY